MKFFIFDVETTGLPPKGKRNVTYRDVDHWPRIVQISWCVMDSDMKKPDEIMDVIIKPQGFTIPPESSEIHRITQEIAEEKGRQLSGVIDELIERDLDECTHVVAHNLSFDSSVFLCELFRLRNVVLINKFVEKVQICTKDISTPWCKLRPFRYGSWKWPTLSELYFILRGRVMDSQRAHNSMYDVEILVDCFVGLAERGLVKGIKYSQTRSGMVYINFENSPPHHPQLKYPKKE